MSVYLGLDLGTTSVSAVAVNSRGEILQQATRSHRADLTGQPEDFAEQHPDRLLATARECLREITQGIGGEIHSLGLTGQMHGMLLLDSRHLPLTPLLTWRDRRCLRSSRPGGPSFLEELQARLAAETSERLGCRLRPGYAAATFDVLRQTGQLPTGPFFLSDITGFVSTVLTRQPPRIDPTFAASWGLYDLQRGTYCEDVPRAAGIPMHSLPELVLPGTIVGTVPADIAREWGLPAEVPVCVGLGDNQAAVLGAVQHPERELLINIGTGGQVAWSHPTHRRTAEIEIRPFPGERFLHVGAGQAGGDAYAWLIRHVHGWLETFGLSPSEEELYERIETARRVVLADLSHAPPICEPFFRGTRAEPERRGLFREVGPENFTLGHLAYSVTAGIVESLCSLYDRAEHRLENLERVIVAGNFFRHHRWTAELIARRWGVPVVTPTHQEQAACGVAFLAGKSVAGTRGEEPCAACWTYETLAESADS